MFLSQFLIGRKSEASLSLSLSLSTTLPLWPLVWLECFSLKIGKRVRAFRLLCAFLPALRYVRTTALPLFQVEINLRIVAWIWLPPSFARSPRV